MNAPAEIPVVVFGFNRPKKLRRVLAALRNQPVDRLIVYIDGPRGPEDREKVQECRRAAEDIDWRRPELRFHDENIGSKNLDRNIAEVFEEFQAAIFLEDDCLPMRGFCAVMREALERYARFEQVFSIGGYQPLPPGYFQGTATAFVGGARFIGWGWATWRDKWREIHPQIEENGPLFPDVECTPAIAGSDLLEVAQSSGSGHPIRDWDYRVIAATLSRQRIHLLPVRGLVRNIGLDRSGVHGSFIGILRDRLAHNRNLADRLPEHLPWPAEPALDCRYVSALNDWISSSRQLSAQKGLKRLRVALRRYLIPGRERLSGLWLAAQAKTMPEKKALVSYITHPFHIPRDDPRYLNHINIHHSYEIVRALNRMGYVVDVIDYRDQKPVPAKDYALCLGHAGENFARLMRQLPADATRICLATTSYWQAHNARELERISNLERRRGVRYAPDRLLASQDDAAIEHADGIIAIGNQATRNTYQDFRRVVMLDGSVLYDDRFEWCRKDYQQGRQHFLYFTSGGSVHKGLDLVLEAFSQNQAHLWVLARVEKRFSQLYRRELHTRPNIHFVGWTRPRSRAFYEVLEKCNWFILPSCSEGQAQSALEAMNQGLVPVVTPQAGLDLEDFGYWIDDPSVEGLQALINRLAEIPEQEIERRSRAARAAAATRYSAENFARNFEAALESILRHE